MKLKFIQYDPTYQTFIEEYRLSKNNLRYTQLPRVAVASPDPFCVHVLVMDADTFVTFFTLKYGENVQCFTTNKNAMLITSFSTDVRHQGKGYAKKTLQQLPAFIQAHFPETNEMVLAVNCHNQPAKGLYKKCGFFDTLERREGRHGPVIIMKKEFQRLAQSV